MFHSWLTTYLIKEDIILLTGYIRNARKDVERAFGVSGFRINMCKSKIMGVNVEERKVQNAAIKLRCLVLKTPFTYLGTKVGDNMTRNEAWKVVVDK
ncbi:hypothetical protein Tco_0333642, partial [Tanacetum coccineum]